MRIIVVIPTFYADKQDIRYQLALDLCREVCKANLEAIIVDASPNHESVKEDFLECGGSGITVVPQTFKGKKGAALREGISLAAKQLQDDDNGVIAFQEPEKVDMIQHWSKAADRIKEGGICVNRRSDASFRATYPIEQYHSENFVNLYLDSLAAAVGFAPSSIDWTMGPIAFHVSLAPRWLEYHGDLWDMQLVPMIRAQRWHKAKIVEYEFDFQHPASMKEQELGSPKWSEKRLFQLNFLFEHVGKALKETSCPTPTLTS